MASKRTPITHGINVAPAEGGNAILAFWQGLYHLFGAKVSNMTVGTDGVSIVGFEVADNYDANQIVADLFKTPRLDLITLLPILNGETPAPFPNAKSLTDWMTNAFRGSSTDGKSPKYSKDAIIDYKVRHDLAVPRGRPRKNVIKIDLDEPALEDMDPVEVSKLREALERIPA